MSWLAPAPPPCPRPPQSNTPSPPSACATSGKGKPEGKHGGSTTPLCACPTTGPHQGKGRAEGGKGVRTTPGIQQGPVVDVLVGISCPRHQCGAQRGPRLGRALEEELGGGGQQGLRRCRGGGWGGEEG